MECRTGLFKFLYLLLLLFATDTLFFMESIVMSMWEKLECPFNTVDQTREITGVVLYVFKKKGIWYLNLPPATLESPSVKKAGTKDKFLLSSHHSCNNTYSILMQLYILEWLKTQQKSSITKRTSALPAEGKAVQIFW